jgi:peroxiredoxin
MGMLVLKNNLGFGARSWRYAAVIENGNIEWMVEEPGREDNCSEDPYVETTPEKVLEYVASRSLAAVA